MFFHSSLVHNQILSKESFNILDTSNLNNNDKNFGILHKIKLKISKDLLLENKENRLDAGMKKVL